MNGILDVMAAELAERREWDEPPALYFLYEEDGGCLLRQLPIPDDRWEGNAPPDVLRWLAEQLAGMGGMLREMAPRELRAVAFRFEAWAITGPAEDPLLRATAEADARDHVLHLRPDRVEARMMLAAGSDGVIYQATARRDGLPEPDVTSGPLGEGGGGTFGGSVPESLSMIIAAICPRGRDDD